MIFTAIIDHSSNKTRCHLASIIWLDVYLSKKFYLNYCYAVYSRYQADYNIMHLYYSCIVLLRKWFMADISKNWSAGYSEYIRYTIGNWTHIIVLCRQYIGRFCSRHLDNSWVIRVIRWYHFKTGNYYRNIWGCKKIPVAVREHGFRYCSKLYR